MGRCIDTFFDKIFNRFIYSKSGLTVGKRQKMKNKTDIE